MSEVHKLSERLIELCERECQTDPEVVRLGLGLTLSGIHSAFIAASRTNEDKVRAIRVGIDTVTRLTEALKRDIERFKIEGVEIESGEVRESEIH